MAVTPNDKPTDVVGQIMLMALRTRLAFAELVNRNYQGDVANHGDTVKITTPMTPTINSYAQYTAMTVQAATAATQSLVITEAKYFSAELDRVDSQQSEHGRAHLAAIVTNGAYQLAKVADAFIASTITAGVGAGNTLTGTTPADASDIWEVIFSIKAVLDDADLPDDSRWIVLPPWAYNLALQETKYVNLQAAGEDALVRGRITTAAGMTIQRSNQLVTSGAVTTVLAGANESVTYADQIMDTKVWVPDAKFTEAVAALHVYGAKVIRPTGVAKIALTKA